MLFEQTKLEHTLLRCLAFGFAKTKKTWWTGGAAEAGFNVIHLSTEKNGHAIFKQLSPEAQARIFVIDISDDLNQQNCAEFLSLFLGGRPFYWNEQTKRYAWHPQAGMIYINPAALTRDTVLVLDNWTSVVASLVARYCSENGIDMADAAKPDWAHFRWCGAFATWMLTQLISVPCHFILVAHSTIYEKRKEVRGTSVVEWSRKQVFSSSGPHGMTIANKFDEVLLFELEGKNFFIDAQSRGDADSGARFTPPARYGWDELPYGALAKLAGIAPTAELPAPDSYFPVVTDEQLAQQSAKAHGLLNTAAPVKPTGVVQPPAAATTRLLFGNK